MGKKRRRQVRSSTLKRLVWGLTIGWITWLLALFIGPFLVPVRPLKGTVPPEDLADEDSQFLHIDGLNVHYKQRGSGRPALLLLHGFGASAFSWRHVLAPLGRLGRAIAYDRPGFGLTERPLDWTDGANPYTLEAQSRLVVRLLDNLGIDKAILVGNSMGGTVALNVALTYPQRVAGLVLVDAAIYLSDYIPAWLPRLLKGLPAMRLGPLLARYAISHKWGDRLLVRSWHDPAGITPAVYDGYTKPSRAENWDYGLWYSMQYHHGHGLHKRLVQLKMPVLVVTGDDDRVVPTHQSLHLAQAIPQAALQVIPSCGHLPQEERPQAFLEAVTAFIQEQSLACREDAFHSLY